MDKHFDRNILFLYTKRDNDAVVRVAFQHKNSPEWELSHEEKMFLMKHINEEMELNSLGSYIPGGQINAFLVKESHKPVESRDYVRFINHLESNQQYKPVINYNLLALGFAKECGFNSDKLDELEKFIRNIISTYANRLTAFCHFQRERQGDKENCEVTAIETRQGVSFFDNSGYGRLAEQKYLQYMAEHFFDPSFDRDTIKRYHFITSDPFIVDISRNAHQYLNPDTFDFNINSHHSQDKSLLKYNLPHVSLKTTPDYDSFSNMLNHCDIEPDLRMKELRFLTCIAQHGWDNYRTQQYYKEDNPESAKAFSGIEQRFRYMDRLHEENNPIRPTLNQEAVQIATRILRDKYHACGFLQKRRNAIKISQSEDKKDRQSKHGRSTPKI